MKNDTRQDYQERMLRVLVHIRENLDEAPKLAEMAASRLATSDDPVIRVALAAVIGPPPQA